MSKLVHIFHNFACARRDLDCTRLANFFTANGFRLTNNPKKADYIIFVTCSFMKIKEEECFKEIKRLQGYRGRLIVVGCLPDISPKRFHNSFHGEYIETRNLEKIDEIFKHFKIKFRDIPDTNKPFRIGEYVGLFYRAIDDFCIKPVILQ